MAWFSSGRNAGLTYEFTLHAHHANGPYYPPPGHAICKSGGRVSGPNFEAELIAQKVNWGDGTVSLFVASVRVFNFVTNPYLKQWSFFSTPIADPGSTFDATAAVTVSINFPVKEEKEVRLGSAWGSFDWLPPDVELEYALHPDPTGDISVEVTSADTHFNGTASYPASNFGPTNNHAPFLGHTLASDASVGGPKNFSGLVAAVTGVSCSLAGLNFSDGGTPNSGFNVTTQRAHCWTTDSSLQLDLIDPQGIPVFSAACGAYPVLGWNYDGYVRAFDQPYPGDPVLYDYARDETYTAPGGQLEGSVAARRFSWGYNVDGQSDSAAVNEHPAYLKLHLDAEWCDSAGENPDDRRIPLEDNVAWDALTLDRDSTLPLEALDDDDGWSWSAGDGTLSTSAGALSAAPTQDDSEIAKTVDHNLAAYRYLKIDLRADSSLTPIRLQFGAYFWDVLVQEADTWETKTLDLAAPHNASLFDDVEALQAISELRFGALQPAIIYGFRDMRLEVADTDHLRVLPPFQQDNILFHDADRRPGLKGAFRSGGGIISLQGLATAIQNRLDSGFEAGIPNSAHSYYNGAAPAGFLEDLTGVALAPPITLSSRVRADRILPWAGMGDPSGAMGTGELPIRFTKRLRGKIGGLCFIRDLLTTSTLSTRIRVWFGELTKDTIQTAEDTRFYESVTLRAGEYNVGRIDPTDVVWMHATLNAVNRAVVDQHFRAQVIDHATRQPIASAEVDAELFEPIEIGDIDYSRINVFFTLSNAGGMYAVAPLQDGAYDAFANTTDGTEDRHSALQMPEGILYDVVFALRPGGTVAGVIKDYQETSNPIPYPHVGCDQSESAWPECETVSGDENGAFEFLGLNARSDRSPQDSDFDIWVQADGYSPKRIGAVRVESSEEVHIGDVLIHPTGSIGGTVIENGQPAVGAVVVADQTDGLQAGWGQATTNGSGEYVLPTLAAGPQSAPAAYLVTVWTPAASQSQTVSVASDQLTTADFTL